VVIVDSSVWIDFLNGVTTPETQWLDFTLDRQRIGVTTLILTEVLQGLRDDREAAAVQAELIKFELIETHDVALAAAAASYYRRLRKQGLTVRKLADLLIAAYCIREEHSLLHADRDFDLFEQQFGLQVIHP
jgi:predicted nucleic acid-binding protein